MAMSILCLRKDDERTSPVLLPILPPISGQISCAAGPHAPRVSMAMGTKECKLELASWLYFARFFPSAMTAAYPTTVDVLRCVGMRAHDGHSPRPRHHRHIY